jgi:hypothetical protein
MGEKEQRFELNIMNPEKIELLKELFMDFQQGNENAEVCYMNIERYLLTKKGVKL